MKSLGIDIAGAPGKGFDLALVEWGKTPDSAHEVSFGYMPHNGRRCANFPIVRADAARGDLESAAGHSFDIVEHVCRLLRPALDALGVADAGGVLVGIDSPLAFSRNRLGQGRATEKVGRHFGLLGQFQARFQLSPSIACGRQHRGEWAWMMFGMAAAFAFSERFDADIKSWREFLKKGFGAIRSGVAEVFPRGAVQYARSTGAKEKMLDVLKKLRGADAEAAMIRASLASGSATGSDRADALLAAISMLGFVFPNDFSAVELRHAQPSGYAPLDCIPWCEEGVITLLG